MRVTDFLVAAAALSMVAAPAVAAGKNPAAKLSLAGADSRSETATSNAEYFPPASGVRANPMLFIGLGVVAVVALALVMGDNDSDPASA